MMPNPSIKNERVYRALRRKGMSKERAARISNAMKSVSAVAPLVVSPTGPGGLLSTAGLGSVASRKKKLAARRKAFDEGKISRDDTGKFSGSGGGGGSGSPAAPAKPPKAPKVPKAEQEAANLASVGDVLNANDDERLGKNGLNALSDFGEGGTLSPTMQAGLEKAGLVKTDRDGVTSLTPEGRKVLGAAKKGDADAVGRALDDAGKRVAGAEGRQAEAEGKRQAREQAKQDRKAALEKKRAERDAAKQKKAADAEAKKKKGGGGGGKKDDKPQKAAPLPPLLQNLYGLAGKSFAVTKDAEGRHRWILRTTTAYRDRDGEILSEAALDADSQRMAALKTYGPLRYWHMGAPDPLNLAAPWGPGVDLGMCDYSQVIGRTRIESGTFYDERVGAAFKAAANQYEVSPGFFHTPDQPRAGGVFTHIQTFERSLVPVRLARASNLFTGMHATKERSAMTPEEFRKRAKAFLDDMAAMGVSPAAAQQTLAAAQTAEKAAAAQGVAYKSAEAQTVYALPDGTPAIIVGGQLVALKAMSQKAPMPPAEMMQAGITEAVDGAAETLEEGAEEAEGDDDAPILGPADLTAIAEAVVGLLMGKMGDMQSQLNAFEEELKQRGYARMKEAADQLGPKIDALTGVLAQYVDDLPATGVRASQDAATVTRADDPTARAAAQLVGAKAEQAAPQTMEERVLAWVAQNNGGALPWDVPAARGLPEGVNLGQHGAPGQQ